VVERVKLPVLRRPCDHNSRDLGSTLTLVVRVVASLDKALCDDYLCLWLPTSKQACGFQQERNNRKTGNGQLLTQGSFTTTGGDHHWWRNHCRQRRRSTDPY